MTRDLWRPLRKRGDTPRKSKPNTRPADLMAFAKLTKALSIRMKTWSGPCRAPCVSLRLDALRGGGCPTGALRCPVNVPRSSSFRLPPGGPNVFEFAPSLVVTGPILLVAGPSSPEADQFRAVSGQADRLRHRSIPVQSWPIGAQVCSELAEFGPNLNRIRGSIGRLRTKLGRSRADSA